MLLYVCIAMDIWCLLVLLFRAYWPCLFSIPWAVLISYTFISMLITFLVHAYSWRCWSFLRYKPRRLRSMSQDFIEVPIERSHLIFTVFIILELCCLSFSIWLGTHSCQVPWWPGLIGFVIILLIYTASTGISSSSSESSNVNTSLPTEDISPSLNSPSIS